MIPDEQNEALDTLVRIYLRWVIEREDAIVSDKPSVWFEPAFYPAGVYAESEDFDPYSRYDSIPFGGFARVAFYFFIANTAKNIIKAATHPLTGPAEIAPEYEKIGNALILAAIVVVIISVVGACIDIPLYLIRLARYKSELSSRTFRELYGAGEIALQIVKYSVFPFIYYAARTFGMAGVFTLAGLAVAPAYIVSDVLVPIFNLIPYVRFGSIFSVAAYAYYLIMLFEGMRAETKIKGNKYAFVFVICITIVGYVAGFF